MSFTFRYNLRRAAAIFWAGCAVALAVLDRDSLLWLYALGVYLVVNVVFCRCPECGRWIGPRPAGWESLPEAFPCEAELLLRERLNRP